jgi:hypothetical protein
MNRMNGGPTDLGFHERWRVLECLSRALAYYRYQTQNQFQFFIRDAPTGPRDLEMDRVKAVWNKYAANKITVTIIKSWKEAMI